MATRTELNKEKQNKIIAEEMREKRKKIVLKTLKIMFLIVLIMSSSFIYITYVSNKKIIVNEKRIVSKNLPNNFDGLKIIQLSDIHYGTTIYKKELVEIVKLINERNPDLVVFTGDLIDKNYKMKLKEKEDLTKILKKINESIGKYAVDGDEDSDEFTTILNQSEFTILNNSYELIYNKNNTPIMITGVSSSLNNKIDVDKAFEYFNTPNFDSKIFTITLTHEPDNTEEILNKYKSDLILAGHSHNGQIRIPYIGNLLKKSGAKKYNNDFYRIKNTELYVSNGLGTNGNGIRLFTHPSINFFRISSK